VLALWNAAAAAVSSPRPSGPIALLGETLFARVQGALIELATARRRKLETESSHRGREVHSSSAPIVLVGQSYTSQSLTELLQSLVDALTKVDAAKAQWNDVLQQEVGLKAEVLPVVRAAPDLPPHDPRELSVGAWATTVFPEKAEGASHRREASGGHGESPSHARGPPHDGIEAESGRERRRDRSRRDADHCGAARRAGALTGTPAPRPSPQPVPSPASPATSAHVAEAAVGKAGQ